MSDFFLVVRLVIVFLSLALFSNHVIAQSNYEDVLYLKNGSIIHGMIIEQIPNESIKIKSGENIFVYRMDEVLKMTKEEVKTSENKKPVSIKSDRKKKGYIISLEWLISKGYIHSENYYNTYIHDYTDETYFDGINNSPSIGFQTVNAYQFNPRYAMGIGTGIHLYSSLFLVPVFLDLHTNFLDKKVTPYADVELGGSFAVHNFARWHSAREDKGGFMGSCALGLKIFVTSERAINFSIGFHYQELSLKRRYIDNSNDYSYSTKPTNRIVLRTGFTF
jgi:hypothetical protein